MRFLIYGIFLAGWLTTWISTYTCHIKKACCPGRFADELPIGNVYPEMRGPVAFLEWESDPITGSGFAFYRDSVLARLDSGKILEITGFFTENESQAIGADRAVKLLEILAEQLEDHRYALKSRKVSVDDVLMDNGPLMLAYDVRILSRNGEMDSVASSESR